MTNGDIQGLFDTIKDEVSGVIMSTFKNFRKEANADVSNLLDNMQEKVRIWTQQLAGGKLSGKDFEFLVLGQKDLIKMNALQKAGMAAIKIDELKDNVLNSITKSVMNFL